MYKSKRSEKSEPPPLFIEMFKSPQPKQDPNEIIEEYIGKNTGYPYNNPVYEKVTRREYENGKRKSVEIQ